MADKIHGKVKAWMRTYTFDTPDSMAKRRQNVAELTYASEETDLSKHNFVAVGEADIEVTLDSPTEIVKSQINNLQEQIKGVRAQSQMQVTQLEAQIQNLLAIEYTPAKVPDPDDDYPF